jgi:hypothetical protein
MPRKKVVTTREELDGKDAETPREIAVPEPESGDALDALLGDAPDETRYKVYLMPAKAGDKLAYCYTYTRDDLSLDTIRDTFGGGSYKITGFDGKNQYVNSKVVTIIGLPKTPQVIAAAPVAAPSSGLNTEVLLLKMMEGQSQMLAALMAREPAPAPAGPSVMEILALIKGMNTEQKSDPVELLLKGLTLGKELGGGGGTDLMDLGKEALQTMAPLIRRQAEAPPTVRVTHPAAPRIAPAAAAPAPTNGAATAAPAAPQDKAQMEILDKVRWLTRMTETLVKRAALNKSAELAAEIFMEDLPAFITPQEVYDRFIDPNSLSMLAQLNPQVLGYAAWFEEFRQAVLASFEAEDEEENPAPPNGAATDSPHVEKPS